MCSSSTLAINPCVFANYPSKKWNTPVPLFHQNQSIFFRNNADFNNSLTKLPLSPYSVEINPAPAALTLFNSKNGCPTSPGTGTLCRQPPMFHPLNPFKTVPPLGHFSHKNDSISPCTNLNVFNFMIRFLIYSKLLLSSNSVETNSIQH